jgi:hypothetical protein
MRSHKTYARAQRLFTVSGSSSLARQAYSFNFDVFSSQCCAEPYAAGNDTTSVTGYDSLSTPPDSDVITPLSSGEAAPIRTAQLQEWHALSQAQGSAYNPYFPPLPERPGVHGYPKDLDGHHPEFHSVI